MKVRGMAIYGTALGADAGHAMPVAGSGLEHRHRNLGGGGNLRAAVFGVNDGLVSNASLILGVAGASSDRACRARLRRRGNVRRRVRDGRRRIRLGALAARAVRVPDRPRARRARSSIPEAEAQELALIYAAKGLPSDGSDASCAKLVADPEHALDTLAREELGLNPEELGSPWGAASSSFLSFAAGALLPLAAVPASRRERARCRSPIGVTAWRFSRVGAPLSLFTGRSATGSGVRMLRSARSPAPSPSGSAGCSVSRSAEREPRGPRRAACSSPGASESLRSAIPGYSPARSRHASKARRSAIRARTVDGARRRRRSLAQRRVFAGVADPRAGVDVRRARARRRRLLRARDRARRRRARADVRRAAHRVPPRPRRIRRAARRRRRPLWRRRSSCSSRRRAPSAGAMRSSRRWRRRPARCVYERSDAEVRTLEGLAPRSRRRCTARCRAT